MALEVQWDTRTATEIETFLRIGAQEVEYENGFKQTAWLAGGGVNMPLGRNTLFADLTRGIGPSSAGMVITRDQLRLRWQRDFTPRLALLVGVRGTHDESFVEDGLYQPRTYATGDAGLQWRWREEFSLHFTYDYTWQKFDRSQTDATRERRQDHRSLSTPATPTLEEMSPMEPQASPEFSDYVHAIARRKALLIGIAIPIAILAVLLSLTLPDIYTSSALVEIDEPPHAHTSAHWTTTPPRTAVTPTSTCRISRAPCSRKAPCAASTRSIDLYPDLEGDESAMLKRLRRDIEVSIVTTHHPRSAHRP